MSRQRRRQQRLPRLRCDACGLVCSSSCSWRSASWGACWWSWRSSFSCFPRFLGSFSLKAEVALLLCLSVGGGGGVGSDAGLGASSRLGWIGCCFDQIGALVFPPFPPPSVSPHGWGRRSSWWIECLPGRQQISVMNRLRVC
eukprot:scaffold12176_cov51-Attheya_sp.AAC.2